MKCERGGTFLGFVIGVVVGLGAALAVAVFVTKVPIQFMNKGQSRSAEQDAAEAKKNKDWDPNAPLYGKNPAKATPPAVAVAPADTAPAVAAPAAVAKTDTKPAPKAEPAPAVAADPLGDLAKAKMASTEPFSYFVQVGAFRTLPDAEGQRAKLSLSGVETKISEREQSGAMVYRVRVGPFDKKDEAERAKEKLESSGIETALVRVQR
jgi:cell division protein FtsN